MTTILITGASRGIGLEMARQAAARGDDVIAAVRDPQAEGPAGLPEAVERLPLDVTDPGSCAALAETLAGRRIDLLVCNAGVLVGRGGMEDSPYAPEDWAQTFAVNVTGVFQTVRALLPRMEAGGRIAVISSMMGSSARAPGGSYIYRASKAAATNLAMNLARELAPRGIAVGAYHPGWVRTDMGGSSADVAVEDSAAGLLARFDELGPSSTGDFRTYSGEAIPF